MLLDVLLGDKADTTLPSSRGIVQDVVDFESVGEHGDQVIQFDFEKDIVFVNVGVDEAEFGGVSGVEESVSSDLEHGSDSGSTSDHTNFFCECRSVLELTFGALDADLVTNFKQRKVPRDIALLVGL